MAGIGGGWGAAILFYPIETVRIFISTSTLPTKLALCHLNQNIKLEGVKHLYRGFSSLLLSIALFRGIFFGYYDTFKGARKEKSWKWITAYFSGLLAGLSVHPVETMRKRAIISKSNLAISRVFKDEGIRGLYRGVSLTPIQSLVGAAILIYFDNDSDL